ncbi:MAG: phosphatase PAP2 family protein [Saezia sp.]
MRQRPFSPAFVPLIICLLAVLFVPLALQLSGWQWTPNKANLVLLSLSFWVSQSMPVVALLLMDITLFLLQLNLRQNILLLASIAVIFLLGAGIKTALKNSWQEPRPYAIWLESQSNLPAQDFYKLPNKSAYLSTLDLSQTRVPYWQQDYWTKNTGYSFPSGHSLFAVQLLLIIATLLWQKKAYIMIALTFCWASAVLSSRLLLGMHWPVDILASGSLAFLIFIPFLLFRHPPLFYPQNKALFNQACK